jgi:hypothetical protein
MATTMPVPNMGQKNQRESVRSSMLMVNHSKLSAIQAPRTV